MKCFVHSAPFQSANGNEYDIECYTVCMKSRTFLAVFLLLLVLALARAGKEKFDTPTAISHPFVFPLGEEEREGREKTSTTRVVLSLRDAEIVAEVADTEAERVRGLGGRKKLGANGGVLFVFPRADYHGIWMKDMMFPIDIIWLEDATPSSSPFERGRGEGGLRVADIKEHVRPETFPEVFYPKVKARYVLEVHAGVAQENGLAVGSALMMKQEKTRR